MCLYGKWTRMTDGSEGQSAGRVSGGAPCGCKVGRVADSYGLTAIDDRLAGRWLGEHGERSSLRELERHFNEAVLRAAMRDVGLDPLDGEVTHIYELLTDEGSSGRMQVRATRRLRRGGIDLDDLQRDFVSHTTIGSHLKECLGVPPPNRDDEDQIEKVEERIFKMQSRAEAVIRGSLEHLRDTGRLRAGELDVFVGARVVCDRCGTQYDVGEFIDGRGCECGTER